MEFIRPFDDTKAFDTGFPGYRAQHVSRLESGLFVHSVIQTGGCGPDLHYHHSDQLYFLLEGEMKVQLGHDVHDARTGALVFIPAGLAHRNWNTGTGVERHFEMIIPTPALGLPLFYPVEMPDAVREEHRADRPGYVRHVDDAEMTEQLPGFRLQELADPGSGSEHAVVNFAEMAPGGKGPGMHVHDFDQYYLVTDGELTVDVGLTHRVVGPNTMVVIPAGVPHRQYNEGTAAERHLVVLTPTPLPGVPWDMGVEFTANGIAHTGGNELVFGERAVRR